MHTNDIKKKNKKTYFNGYKYTHYSMNKQYVEGPYLSLPPTRLEPCLSLAHLV